MFRRNCEFRKLAMNEFPMWSDRQEHLYNLWSSVQNENVGSLVEILLRISK